MNTVLVTGGLGTIGAYVCRALIATSRQPVIYDLGGDTGLIHDFVADCVVERGDICDLPRLMGVISQHKPTAVVHLAGLVKPSSVAQFPWSSINTNLIGTTTVFEAARFAGLQRIVFPSSRQVYGPVAMQHRHPTYEPVPEEHPREPLILYGKLKRACEDVADHYAQLYGLDIIALRFASVHTPALGLIEAAIAHRPFLTDCGADQCDELCYPGECANGIIAALDSAARPGKFRVYNIGSGELISLREMIAVLQDLHPKWSAKAGPGLDGRREAGSCFRMASQKARTELGFKPLFDFRRAAIDYAETVKRLKKGIS